MVALTAYMLIGVGIMWAIWPRIVRLCAKHSDSETPEAALLIVCALVLILVWPVVLIDVANGSLDP